MAAHGPVKELVHDGVFGCDELVELVHEQHNALPPGGRGGEVAIQELQGVLGRQAVPADGLHRIEGGRDGERFEED